MGNRMSKMNKDEKVNAYRVMEEIEADLEHCRQMLELDDIDEAGCGADAAAANSAALATLIPAA
jgi:hypothetical protein